MIRNSSRAIWPASLATLLALFGRTPLAFAADPETKADPAKPAPAAKPADAGMAATKKDGMYAVIETTMGTIVCKLHYDKTPMTVGNFVGLATGEREWTDPKTGQKVKRPLYDGLKFHRVIPAFMIQTGDPLGNGTGGPGYKFADEIKPELKHDKPGILSMANSGPATNGSQFFITHRPTPHLDGKHTVFGEVVSGQDIVVKIADVPKGGPQNSTPVTDVLMKKVTIVRTGAGAQAFDWAKAVGGGAAGAKASAAPASGATGASAQAGGAAAGGAAAKSAPAGGAASGDKTGIAKTLGVDLSKVQKTASGLEYVVTKPGTGAKPTKGQKISAHYTGYLLDGKKFDSSRDRGTPFETPIGVGSVIKGWDEAFQDMKVGEKRVLFIPSNLGYGAAGYGGGIIPPNAPLVFDVELLGVK